jgi:hypothetical protein
MLWGPAYMVYVKWVENGFSTPNARSDRIYCKMSSREHQLHALSFAAGNDHRSHTS